MIYISREFGIWSKSKEALIQIIKERRARVADTTPVNVKNYKAIITKRG